VFAQKAKSLGIPVVCVGVRHEAAAELAGLVHRFYWAGVAKLGRMIRCFRHEKVEQVVMAGKIHKATFMHRPWRVLSLLPDLRMVRFWYGRLARDKRDDTILLGLIDEFARERIYFRSALDLCPELLVRPGILTRRKPTKVEEADIQFGWDMAKEMGRLDVGQSVAVKERAVLAVEAIEGTDRAIGRAGELCPAGGFVVIKVASRNRTCASMCRPWAVIPSKQSIEHPAGCSPSKPAKPSSSTSRKPSPWPTATASPSSPAKASLRPGPCGFVRANRQSAALYLGVSISPQSFGS